MSQETVRISGWPRDLSGFRFGSLVVLRFAKPEECAPHQNQSREQKYRCKCDCGSVVTVFRNSLISGSTKSCGCARRGFKPLAESTPKPADKVMNATIYNDLKNKWNGMRNRCYSPSYTNRDQYGGRGIAMDPSWRDDFLAFYDWAIANGYKPGLSLDRVNVDSNYEPGNCRWITMKEQQVNKQNTVHVNASRSIPDLCKQYKVSETTVRDRLKRGWTLEDALTKKVTRKYYYGGRDAEDLSKMVGVGYSTLRTRMARHGDSLPEAMIHYARLNGHADLIDWIKKNVPATRDEDGHIYPESNRVSDVLKVVRQKEEDMRLIQDDLTYIEREDLNAARRELGINPDFYDD